MAGDLTRFALWAPTAARVRVRTSDTTAVMHPDELGWWRAEVAGASHGTDYAFLVGDQDQAVPDPRSRWQPYGPGGPSRVYDHRRFHWSDADWAGRPVAGGVLYELRPAAFTELGTLDAVTEHLDHLAALGVDMVELRGATDAGAAFAPPEALGGPDALKRFVDGCHVRDIGVLLEWVHPAGEPAGVDAALAWLRDYHLDGLRVHDDLYAALVPAAEALAVRLERPLAVLAGDSEQDEAEHALRSLLSGGVPTDPIVPGSLECLADVLREALVFTGTWSRPLGRLPSGHQFGRTPQRQQPSTGRDGGALPDGLIRVAATLLYTGPFTPMLFMGEEWGTSVSWSSARGAARACPPGAGTDILDWSQAESAGSADMLTFYRRLLSLRRSIPDLSELALDRIRLWYGDQFIVMLRGEHGVVANLAPTHRRVSLDQYPRQVLLATDRRARVTRDSVELPPFSAMVVSFTDAGAAAVAATSARHHHGLVAGGAAAAR